ncbi:Plasmodium exported protein, unknown function [Plasmodium vivax]|uniref:Uncharacterized protein n=1 Tax=Plasmodium vivax TaxID=5855 RepID=A0A565A426_PLAVI|nr:Plasmodium exported protein, unknown function [Plasmodium vivax]
MFLYHNIFFVFILITSICLYCPHETTSYKLLYKNISVNNKNFEVKVLLSYAKLGTKKKTSRVDRILASIYEDIKRKRQQILDAAPSNKIKVKQIKKRRDNLKRSKLNSKIHDSSKRRKTSLFKRIKLLFRRKKKDKFARLKYLFEMSEKNIREEKENKKKKKKNSKFKELRNKISYPHLFLSLIGLLAVIGGLSGK